MRPAHAGGAHTKLGLCGRRSLYFCTDGTVIMASFVPLTVQAGAGLLALGAPGLLELAGLTRPQRGGRNAGIKLLG